jgi:hypothetical protein
VCGGGRGGHLCTVDLDFTAGVADTGGNLPSVSLTLVANLQRWPHNYSFKSANSWSQSAIANQ